MSQPAVGRRLFLGGLGVCLAALAFGGRAPAALRAWVEAPLGDLAPGDGFHFYSVTGSVPGWQRRTWRLVLDGLVERPQSLSVDDLRARPLVAVRADFHCVSGWSVPAVRWEGVAVSDLLDTAGVKGEAGAIRFESADGSYVDYLDLATARRSGVILAMKLRGVDLSAARGAPVRLIVPFYYGYKSVKWLRRVTVVEAAGTGYWEARGYDDDARIRN